MEVLYTGLFCGLATMFLNYCIGKPASEKFSPYEIFSEYTVWLSTLRLKKVGLFLTYYQQYAESKIRLQTEESGPTELIQLDNDYKKLVYEAAEPFFTWERAAGMCPVCFGFWLSLILTGLYLFWRPQNGIIENAVFLIFSILIAHVTIRIIAKYL